MSTCPWCGMRVPFGGGKTAQNASKLKEESLAIARVFDEWSVFCDSVGEEVPESTREAVLEMAARGDVHAVRFHQYAHKQTMEQPMWAAAGVWSREAQGLIAQLAAAIQEGRAMAEQDGLT